MKMVSVGGGKSGEKMVEREGVVGVVVVGGW